MRRVAIAIALAVVCVWSAGAMAQQAVAGGSSAPAAQKFTKDPMKVGLLTEKQWAIGSLALDRKPASKAALKQALSDADPVVRRFAVFGLERIGTADPASASVVDDIIPLLKDADSYVRQQAANSLGKLKGPQAVAPLLAALSSDDLSLRGEAFVALGLIGDPATQGEILKALGDKRLWTDLDMWAQRFALGVIERPFFTDKAAIPFLKSLLKLRDWDNPALAGFTPQAKAQHTLLISNAAADILATKFDDPSGEDLLIEAFTTEDDYMHQASIKALGKIRSKKAIPALLNQEANSEWTANRRRAITALGQIGDASAVPELEKLLVGANVELRGLAAAALEKIDGKKRAFDANDPPAVPQPVAEASMGTPLGKRPPQFICLGVDDCANPDGLESMLDICQTLQDKGSKAVFTMWLAPLIGDWEVRDMEKQTLLVRRLFDMGCEIAHHTLMHNPEGKFWRSQPPAIQVREIEGCTQWDRSHIPGFIRPFSHKGGGGGSGRPTDPNFSSWLMAQQHFLYTGFGRRSVGPDLQLWPQKQPAGGSYRIDTGCLDAAAPPVHAKITDPIFSDYGGRFEYEVPAGVAMWKANFEYHYSLPRRPILAVNAFHDWGLRRTGGAKGSHRNEGRILKEFLVDVLVANKDKYPEAHCVTYRQVVEYIASDGDLKHTLEAGNCQDSRNPVKPKID